MNPYEVLGVARDATAAQIRAAYRKLAKRAHPDAGGEPGVFERLNACYELLMDPARRARYDRTGDFEEAKPDNSHVEPLALISERLSEILAQAANPEEIDLVEVLRRQLQKLRAKLEEVRTEGLEKREKTRKLAGRFSVGKGRDNFLEGMIAGRLAAIEHGLAAVAHQDEVAHAALKLLKDCTFRADPARRQQTHWRDGIVWQFSR